MPILPMAAFSSFQEPSIFRKQLKDITDFHAQTLLLGSNSVKQDIPIVRDLQAGRP